MHQVRYNAFTTSNGAYEMAHSLYVCATTPRCGKVLVTVGMMNALDRTIGRLGFFRPFGVPYTAGSRLLPDRQAHLVKKVFQLEPALEDMIGIDAGKAGERIAAGEQGVVSEAILSAFKRLEEQVDFVLCEGTDFMPNTSLVEAELNSDVARDLNVPVALVIDGSSGDADGILSKTRIGMEAFVRKGCEVLAVFVNKVPVANLDGVRTLIETPLRKSGVEVIGLLPFEPQLAMPRMDQISEHLGGRVLFGHAHLHNKVGRTIVASGSVETMIPLLDNDVLLVTHLDRHDAIFMALVALTSRTAPNIGGMVLSGEQELSKPVQELLSGLPGPRFPIVRSPVLTYETVMRLSNIPRRLEPEHQRDLEIVRQLFDANVDTEGLMEAVRIATPSQMSPKAFKFELIKRARLADRHIVLPEGNVERIIRASDALIRLKAVRLTLLGDPAEIENQAGQLHVDLGDCTIVDPHHCEWSEELAGIYQTARAHKGMTIETAREAILDPAVFGTLMVHTGRADGMVSGATTSTAATIRPAFQLIKTRPDVSLVSSVFFMCLQDRVLVYGDCAVNPDPTPSQLAEIAAASAGTASAFGIEPIVAMLSYSTGSSGSGADVDKVREATAIARERYPDLRLEGPLQYDAAVDAEVARTKLPDSDVAGRATVLIFPDLNTGNNTYKAVQRSAGAVAIGPVLQGLNKPVNDLSRGCTIEDIINTVAITAIQA